MSAIFTLPDAIEDDNVCIMDKYQFKDRKFETDDHSGKLISRILCTFHACTVEYTQPKVAATTGEANDLSKAATKPATKVATKSTAKSAKPTKA